MSLGSNGMDLVRSLRKIPTSLRGTNFCVKCTHSPRFPPSFMQLRNDPKCTKILQRSNGVDQVRLLGNITTWLRGMNFCINCTSSVCFAPSFMQLRNDPKCTQIHRNITLASNWVDWVCPLQKIPTWLRDTNFCISCTSSPRFAPTFMQLRNDPKCTKILQRSNGVD